MPFITFIYRIENAEKNFYGKYICDDVSNNYEGLDIEIKNKVIYGINEYRNQKGLDNILDKKLCIGILSFSSDRYTYIYSSDEEIKCFDFYYIDCYDKSKTYINGQIIC